MTGLNKCLVHCVYSNITQKSNMMSRFARTGIICKYYSSITPTNDRSTEFTCGDHLHMIREFYYDTTMSYGIFCEAEIHIHKDLGEIMTKILSDFNVLNLDVLLLGYHIPFIADEIMLATEFPLKRDTNSRAKYKYHNYPYDVVGKQMYIISRNHAKYVLDKYYAGYINKTFIDDDGVPFSLSDFIITCDGNTALISPALAVVNTKNKSELGVKGKNFKYNTENFI